MEQNYELYHYGILGMKWGIRRYQNEDGSLTTAGRKHYGSDKLIGNSRRLKRAIDAAQINQKIIKLELKKRKTDKRVFKINRLKKMYTGLISELDDKEIAFGKSQYKINDVINYGGKHLGIIGALAAAGIMAFSDEAKETKTLRKELKEHDTRSRFKAKKESKD